MASGNVAMQGKMSDDLNAPTSIRTLALKGALCLLVREVRLAESACLPAKYGNWRGVYNRLRTCAVDGTWERVLTELVVDELPAPDPAGVPSRAHAPAVQGAMTTEPAAWRHSARAGCPHGA
ncbi:hypothetical protein SAMN06272775_3311 [Streptomyces sp. 2323.1]|nr:hypothetical protein SAMN06272775_3311 [Streptomyces sp. 2323.1]